MNFIKMDYSLNEYGVATVAIIGILSGACVFLWRKFKSAQKKITELQKAAVGRVDITAEQLSLLKMDAELQHLIVDRLPILLMLVDKDLSILQCNKKVFQQCGLSSGECLEKRYCHNIFCGKNELERNKDCLVLKTFSTEKACSEERKLFGRDMLVTAVPISLDETVKYVLECAVDLTKMNESKELLRAAAETANQAARAKSMFLATISHELRTPLNAVIGFSELLQAGGMTEQKRNDAIAAINIAGNTLLALINDVLDLSKLEAGQMTIVKTRLNLNRLAKELKTIFSCRFNADVTAEYHIPDNLPCLWIDGLRLRQILLNLINNAAKFTVAGQVDIAMDFTPVNTEYGTITFSVKDTGVGIAADNIDRIFEPFVQGRNSNTQQIQGTGLGLPICRRLASQMGGTLMVDSKENVGSCFTFILPDVKYEENSDEIEPELNQSCKLNSKILVVDDVPVNLTVLEAMLNKLDLTVYKASNGIEALRTADEIQPDVILTDMWMPAMNGDELARKIRQNCRNKHIKIVAVTADAEAGGNFEPGLFNGVLLKPITLNKLRKMIAILENDCTSPEGGGGGYCVTTL